MARGRHKIPDTILGRLDSTPPFIVFALARLGKGNANHRPRFPELADRAGISKRTFARIADKTSWANVTVADADAFFRACNVKVFRMGKEARYIRSMAKAGKFRLLTSQQQRRFEQRYSRWEKERNNDASKM